jgi:thiamine pyrophosphokinase
MNRCILIPSYVTGQVTNLISPCPTDMILCADSGLILALQVGLIPHAVIGDMDSLAERNFDRSKLPESVHWIQSPREKDQTDTGLCMEYALSQGCEELIVVGGIGGRLDHTLANLQDMVGFSRRGLKVSLLDENTRVFIISDGSRTIEALPGFSLSVLSFSEQSNGVTLTGVAYPLTNATLTHDFPLGVSNEITGEFATVSVAKGTLLVICSKKQTDSDQTST